MNERAQVGGLRGALASALEDISIPPRPKLLEGVVIEVRSPEPNFFHLDRLIGADVGLAAGLVKVANSPYFSTGRRVCSVREAIVALGLNAIARSVAGLCLRNAFQSSPPLERFWDSSAKIAAISGWLVRELRRKDCSVDEAYTFGLFRDCGIPILLTRFPSYIEALRFANADDVRSFTHSESVAVPVNHAQVGALMCQSWWLPVDLCDAVIHHHDLDWLTAVPGRPHRRSAVLVSIVQLAEHLLQRQTGLCQTQEWNKLGPTCLDVLNLTEIDIVEVARSLPFAELQIDI